MDAKIPKEPKMNVINQAEKAVGMKISACEGQVETWKEDHKFAMMVFGCETLLNDVIECFDSIEALNNSYTDLVISNPDRYFVELDSVLKLLSSRWLNLAKTILVSFIEVCIREGYEIANEDAFRERLSKAEKSFESDFDSYAIAKTPVLDIEKLRSIASSVSNWPEF